MATTVTKGKIAALRPPMAIAGGPGSNREPFEFAFYKRMYGNTQNTS